MEQHEQAWELYQLVERARDGDEQAWEVLFRRSYPRLVAYAGRRLPSPDQAKDAAGETMTRAVANIDRLRHDGAGFDAWLYGIARHVVVDAQRVLWREGPGSIPDAADDGAPEPDDRALDNEDAARVRAAFGQLSHSDQELLELRVVAELSADEVASVTGRRPGAVRTAQSRALGRLRSLLGENVTKESGGVAAGRSAAEPGGRASA